MKARDEDGRPVATRNAGAFLAPTGMIPVPSKILDAPEQPPAQQHPGPLIPAGVAAIAMWTLLHGVLSYLLAATDAVADEPSVVVGDGMTRLLHTDLAWYALNGLILALAVVLAARWAHLGGRRDLLVLAAIAIAGAVVVGAIASLLGGLVMLVAMVASLAWLALWSRRWR